MERKNFLIKLKLVYAILIKNEMEENFVNCPVCNKEMEYGEIGSTRIDESFIGHQRSYYEFINHG